MLPGIQLCNRMDGYVTGDPLCNRLGCASVRNIYIKNEKHFKNEQKVGMLLQNFSILDTLEQEKASLIEWIGVLISGVKMYTILMFGTTQAVLLERCPYFKMSRLLERGPA